MAEVAGDSSSGRRWPPRFGLATAIICNEKFAWRLASTRGTRQSHCLGSRRACRARPLLDDVICAEKFCCFPYSKYGALVILRPRGPSSPPSPSLRQTMMMSVMVMTL
eukprot:301311-Pyramimonas_sp.AAC.1